MNNWRGVNPWIHTLRHQDIQKEAVLLAPRRPVQFGNEHLPRGGVDAVRLEEVVSAVEDARLVRRGRAGLAEAPITGGRLREADVVVEKDFGPGRVSGVAQVNLGRRGFQSMTEEEKRQY